MPLLVASLRLVWICFFCGLCGYALCPFSTSAQTAQSTNSIAKRVKATPKIAARPSVSISVPSDTNAAIQTGTQANQVVPTLTRIETPRTPLVTPVDEAAKAPSAGQPAEPEATAIPKAEAVHLPAGYDSATGNKLNNEILRIVDKMPRGGGYSVGSLAKKNFINATRVSEQGSIEISASNAKPSFCSSATYLVFLQLIRNAEESGQLALPVDVHRALLASGQADGVGVWGRWNSNGPGTAKLFHDLRIGTNFTSLDSALPGDFLKIWWTDKIGAKEKGHSVLFLGTQKDSDGNECVRYWSSNTPDGYGEDSAPLSRIKHMVFSRVSNISAVKNVGTMQKSDPYLASMLKIDEDWHSMLKQIGVSDALSPSRHLHDKK